MAHSLKRRIQPLHTFHGRAKSFSTPAPLAAAGHPDHRAGRGVERIWYYGVNVAAHTAEGWREREAKAGRLYACARQEIGGFPFGIRIRCADASAELTSTRPPFAIKAKELLLSASLLQPTVLTSQIVSPMTIAEPGQTPAVIGRWRHAETKLQGLPIAPEQATITIEEPVFDRAPDGVNMFKGTRAVIVGRMVSGTVFDNPVLEITVKLVGAAAPYWHTAAATPTDAELTACCAGSRISRRSPAALFANCRPRAAASRSTKRACSRAR